MMIVVRLKSVTIDNIASTPPDSKSPPMSVASWAQSNGVGVFGAGLSEALPLHVTCHVASDGTKLESTGSRHHPAVISVFPGAFGGADPTQVYFTSRIQNSYCEIISPDTTLARTHACVCA
jgi:hypothetical protein